jgi:DNA-binding beta-propeller fold protein YncE
MRTYAWVQAVLLIFLFTSPLLLLTASVNAQSENYVVTEAQGDAPSLITPNGDRTVIYSFASTGSMPEGFAVDSSGNYVVVESAADTLSKITPDGVRTVICKFPLNSEPAGVAIDSAGNYIVVTQNIPMLWKVTPNGVRTSVYNFSSGILPDDVKVDSSGNYLVTEDGTNVLSKLYGTAADLFKKDPRFVGSPTGIVMKSALSSSHSSLVRSSSRDLPILIRNHSLQNGTLSITVMKCKRQSLISLRAL